MRAAHLILICGYRKYPHMGVFELFHHTYMTPTNTTTQVEWMSKEDAGIRLGTPDR